jgi:cellulose synthase/poly-beta-1,6-N-acetylglucosamine synthase-like glycosyltransferase
VVADNCTDKTALCAREEGAYVWERRDFLRKSKGYALCDFFEWALKHLSWDACVVVDADTHVGTNMLRCFSSKMSEGFEAIQAEYSVKNPNHSWRTRLMAIAFAMFHKVRNRGRSVLGVSVGLRGNGMCFTRALLEKHPYQAYGLVEDVEYTLQLVLNNIPVVYHGGAYVWGDMVPDARHSVSQRRRWESGRNALKKQYTPLLLKAWMREPSKMLWDALMDVWMPPLASVVLWFVAACGVGVFLAAWDAVPFWIFCGVCLMMYGVQGMFFSGLGWRCIATLCMAPWYVVWKASVKIGATRAPAAWVRTHRQGEV